MTPSLLREPATGNREPGTPTQGAMSHAQCRGPSRVSTFGIQHSAFRPGCVAPDRSETGTGRNGQVAVEWLMVAGILTAVAIVLTGMFQPVLVSTVRMIARSVRTVGL